MMLKNSFYNVTRQYYVENVIDALFDIDAAHEVFNGHFPEQPIVPGVFQIQIIKELMEETMDCSLQLETSKEIKFIRPISPETFNNLCTTITIKEQTDALLAFSAQIKNTNTVFMKLRGTYKTV